MKRTYKVILIEEAIGYSVYIPAFDGWTEGSDKENAIFMARDYMRSVIAGGRPVPKEGSSVIKNSERELLVDVDFSDILSEKLTAKVQQKEYDKSVWIYEQSADMKNRFLLGKQGKKKLICCGINPSYASPEDLDPTMKNVEFFVEKYGFDGYVMINLYPQRSTNPKDLHKVKDELIVKNNLELIDSVMESGECEIWAAWGTLIEQEKYLKECLADLVNVADKHSVTWFTIGERSKKGHPHHPLYLNREKSEKASFNVHAYLEDME